MLDKEEDREIHCNRDRHSMMSPAQREMKGRRNCVSCVEVLSLTNTHFFPCYGLARVHKQENEQQPSPSLTAVGELTATACGPFSRATGVIADSRASTDSPAPTHFPAAVAPGASNRDPTEGPIVSISILSVENPGHFLSSLIDSMKPAPPSWLGSERSLVLPLVPRKPHWPIADEEDGAFPVEQSLAPTVVESNVPERTRRIGEYGARVSGRKITVSFFAPAPLKQEEQTKPAF
ncbi:hypothetical protein NQZ68_017450 [Dissostichus eleginoides]|nr:hypothetical protein NQZ68_017450 [Dissostichus eleginoides]